MSATAASTPVGERSTEPIFDREWLNAALIRWKAAEDYVSFLDVELLPTEHVLLLKQLEERSRRGYASEYDLAIVYAGLGEKDRAFEWLAKSCNNRDKDLVSLAADLELDSLRSDSRFQDLLRCVGLPQ